MTTTTATDKVDMVEVVQKHVALKGSGSGAAGRPDRYRGFCPFCHSETQSFFVTSGEKGFYHCFACGDGGDVTRFLERISPLQPDEGQGH